MATKKSNGFNIKRASTSALADFGGAAAKIAKKNAVLSDDIKAELRDRANKGNTPNDEAVTFTGDDFAAVVGKTPEKINIKELENTEIIEMVGQDVFNALSSFPIGRLREYLSKKDFDALAGEPEAGTRPVSFKERNGD